MKKGMTVVAVSLAALAVEAKIEMGTPFSDGAVLQRQRPVPVWGKAAPGREVVVSFAGNEVATTSDSTGCWKVSLPAMEASKESRTLTATERIPGWLWDDVTDVAEVKDVLVGEVWMCAGQSNTDCPIWGGNPRYRDGMGAMAIQTTRKPFVRLVKTPRASATEPRHGYRVRWTPMTPEMLDDFRKGGALPSAMGYYFALELANALDIPVGLVDSSWGGTNIDAWTPPSGYDGLAELSDVAALPRLDAESFPAAKANGVYKGKGIYGSWIQQPSALWNGMVAAYAPMACRGFIWYQGCHNSGEPQRYCAKMHALYNGWKREFANPEMKLYFVQLAPWGFKDIAAIQMAQAKFAAEEENAAMAVINDIGNLTDIHPNDKRTVAKRLAAHALRRDYGWNWVRDDSPTFRSMAVKGDTVTLAFDGAEGWYLYNPKRGDRSNGFEIAGADGVFKPAEIVNLKVGKSFDGNVVGRDLVLRAKGVAAPTQVRYLHSSPWFGGLYNEICLPLGAFEAKVP